MTSELERAGMVMADLGLNVNAWNTRVIMAEALRRDIEVTRLSEQGGVLLTHGRRTHRWRNSITSLNSRLVKRVLGNKDVASRLLRAQGLPALENAIFAPDEAERAWHWAEALGSSVIKPHDAKRGAGVHVDLRTRGAFLRAYRRVAETYGSVLVEKYQSGQEYRFLLVDGRLVGVMERRPASVLGDGHASVDALVQAKNVDRGRIHKPLQLGDPELRTLAAQGLRASSVPDAGQRVFLRKALNLHFGGDAVEVRSAVTDREVAVMERAAGAIPGARLLGIDALVPRGSGHDEIGIIEMNGAPLVSMHHFPWEGQPVDAARAIIDAMFPETTSSR